MSRLGKLRSKFVRWMAQSGTELGGSTSIRRDPPVQLRPLERSFTWFFIVLGVFSFGYSIAQTNNFAAWDAWSDSLRVFGTLAGVILAFATAGGFLGFLFGIPRSPPIPTVEKPAEANVTGSKDVITKDIKSRVFRVNTNLEQLSDWITKIIIGAALVEAKGLIGALNDAAIYFKGRALHNADGADLIFLSIAITSSFAGFALSYIETRTRMVNWIKEELSDRGLLNERDSGFDEAELTRKIPGVKHIRKFDSYLTHVLASFEHSLGATDSESVDSSDRPRHAQRFSILLRVDPGRFDPKRIVNLEVNGRLGDILGATATLASFEALQSDPAVLSVEASRGGIINELASSVPFAHGDIVHRPPIAEDGRDSIVAVIDDGIDLLHECFLDGSNRSRVEIIWDQTDDTGPSPSSNGYPAEYNFGTLHTKDKILQYLEKVSVPLGLGRNIGVPPNVGGHGTHVTSIAAGRAAGSFFGGMAPNARIVFVRPTTKVSPEDPLSLGYSTSHVAALSFINHVATNLGLPVAVNVSLGMNAGAHDGSSLLEAAFDAFSNGGRKPGRAIIKSAGNERDQRGHASLILGPGMLERLCWASEEEHVGPDNIELWFHSSDDLGFRLVGPNGNSSPWIDSAKPSTSGAFSPGVSYRLSLDRYFQDNGDTRLLITIYTVFAYKITAGNFVLEIHARSVRSNGRIDAWIERTGTRPIRFVNNVDESITLSIPGTARTVLAVASVRAALPLVSSTFSSRGLSRDGRDKPDISAPGDNIAAAQSGTCHGSVVMSGTSMAAPHVTGAVALMFSHRKRAGLSIPNAMQIAAALRATARNSNGRHTPSVGYGVLDAEALIKAFS